MRKIMVVIAVLAAFLCVNPASAQYAHFGPIGRPMVIARPIPIAQPIVLAPGQSAAEPGCNISVGGRCGKDLRGECATWDQMRRVNHGGFPQPPECQDLGYGGGRIVYGGRPLIRGIPQVMIMRQASAAVEHLHCIVRNGDAVVQVYDEPCRHLQAERVAANVPTAMPPPVRMHQRVPTQHQLPRVTDSEMAELRKLYK